MMLVRLMQLPRVSLADLGIKVSRSPMQVEIRPKVVVKAF